MCKLCGEVCRHTRRVGDDPKPTPIRSPPPEISLVSTAARRGYCCLSGFCHTGWFVRVCVVPGDARPVLAQRRNTRRTQCDTCLKVHTYMKPVQASSFILLQYVHFESHSPLNPGNLNAFHPPRRKFSATVHKDTGSPCITSADAVLSLGRRL